MSTRLGACSDHIRGDTVPTEGPLQKTNKKQKNKKTKQTNKPRSHTSRSSPGLRPTITQAHPGSPQQGKSTAPPHRTPQHPKKTTACGHVGGPRATSPAPGPAPTHPYCGVPRATQRFRLLLTKRFVINLKHVKWKHLQKCTPRWTYILYSMEQQNVLFIQN